MFTFAFRYTYDYEMEVSQFLHLLAKPGVLDTRHRDMLYSNIRSLISMLQDKDCQQLRQLEIDYNLVEVSISMYLLSSSTFRYKIFK